MVEDRRIRFKHDSRTRLGAGSGQGRGPDSHGGEGCHRGAHKAPNTTIRSPDQALNGTVVEDRRIRFKHDSRTRLGAGSGQGRGPDSHGGEGCHRGAHKAPHTTIRCPDKAPKWP